MNMRMVLEGLSPGMENGEKPDLGSKVLWIASYCLERFLGGLEQKIVDDSFIRHRQRRKLVRHGENDVEILHGQ
jgi:hypothetical protein